jgi:hypothetical protein
MVEWNLIWCGGNCKKICRVSYKLHLLGTFQQSVGVAKFGRNHWYNKKTARVCILRGNITRVVLFAGKPTRPQVEYVASQAKKTTSVIFPLKTYASAVFCLSHANIKSILKHF